MPEGYTRIPAELAVDRCKQKEWTRVYKWSSYMPNYEEYNKEANDKFEFVLNGLTASIMNKEEVPALQQYLKLATDYVNRFYHRYSLEHLSRLIKMVYMVMTRKNCPVNSIHLSANLLVTLCGHSRLTRADFTLDWRPIYELVQLGTFGKIEDLKVEYVVKAAAFLRKHFPADCAVEIWPEIRRMMAPDMMIQIMCSLADIFLPTDLTLEEHKKWGTGLWFEDIWHSFSMVEMNDKWGTSVLTIFGKLARDCPGSVDWRPHYEEMFTKVLRAMKLTARDGKVELGDGTHESGVDLFGRWIVYTYGGSQGCDAYLHRMLSAFSPQMNPLNEGKHTKTILSLIIYLSKEMIKRVRRERIKEHTMGKRPESAKIKDSEIHIFVKHLLPLVSSSLFCNLVYSSKCASALQNLAALDPHPVIVNILEEYYPAVGNTLEPNRHLQMLHCIMMTTVFMTRDKEVVPKISTTPATVDYEGNVEEGDSKKAQSGRCHMISILELLPNSIDVSEMNKSGYVILIAYAAFSLFPVIDCSSQSARKDLTGEERELCKMTEKLPKLVDDIMDKLISLIENCGISAPKNSTEVIGSLHDAVSKPCEEEKGVNGYVMSFIQIVMTNAEKKIRDNLAKKVFHFVTTSFFENLIAAEMCNGMMSNVCQHSAQYWRKFFNYLYVNLKSLLTEKALEREELDNNTLWFVTISGAIPSAKPELFAENKEQMIELISLMIRSKNMKTSRTGIKLYLEVLNRLLDTYPYHGEAKTNVDRPLSDWLPIKEWGKLVDHKTLDMEWHVPDEKDVEMAKHFLKIFHQHIEYLRNPEKMSKNEMSTSALVLYGCYTAICPFVWLGDSPPIPSRVSSIPLTDDFIENPKYEIRCPDGSRIYAVLLDVIEPLINYMVEKRPDDVDTFQTLAMLVHLIVDPREAKRGNAKRVGGMVTVGDMLMECPLTGMAARDHCERRANYSYLKHLSQRTMGNLKQIHERATLILTNLSFSVYQKVRSIAQKQLAPMTGMSGIQMIAAREVDRVLRMKNIDDRVQQAVLEALVLWNLGTTENPVVRRKMYSSLITMQESNLNIVLKKYEMAAKHCNKVNETMYYNNDKIAKENPELTQIASAWFRQIPKNGLWKPYRDPSFMKEGVTNMQLHLEQARCEHSMTIEELKVLFVLPTLSLRRTDLARHLLLSIQGFRGDVDTVKIALRMLVDERAGVRRAGSQFLCDWLKKNKPKTKRIEWKCPARPSTVSHYSCGVREDNMSVVYDPMNLPNTEEKWNQTIFVPKGFGAYQFPKTLNVCQPWSNGDPIDRKEYNEAEQMIVDHFKKLENIDIFINYKILEMNGEEVPYPHEQVGLLKYVLRNFPREDDIFQYLCQHLKNLMSSNKMEEQRCAAMLLPGIVMGSRHYSFKLLDSMWKWLVHSLELLFRNMLSNADAMWTQAWNYLFMDFDARQIWWMVEAMVNAAQTTRSKGRLMELRFDVVKASGWRDTTIVLRMTNAAWNFIPRALLLSERKTIASVFYTNMTCEMRNYGNSFGKLPSQFGLQSINVWIKRLLNEVNEMLSAGRSPTDPTSPHKNLLGHSRGAQRRLDPQSGGKGRKRLSGDEKLDAKKAKTQSGQPAQTTISEPAIVKSLIYLRILVETLAYYFHFGFTSYNDTILEALPVLLVYATNEDAEDEGETALSELRVKASELVFSFMSGSYVKEEFADKLLDTLLKEYRSAFAWRLRMAILKYVDASVVCNLFVFERPDRKRKVTEFVLDGLKDPVLEVRSTCAASLMNLVNYTYIAVDERLTTTLSTRCNSSDERLAEGAAMGVCALVQAHPFDCPPFMVPLLRTLCGLARNRNLTTKKFAENALREFRRTHRDSWPSTVKIIGSQLAYEVENAGAPAYYT